MKQLPTKTHAPASMQMTAPNSVNGHAYVGSPETTEAAPPAAAPDTPPRLKLLRFPAIRERTGLSRSTIWRLEHEGRFPRRHWISANAVAWVEEDVMEWIRRRLS